jgi:aerobic carbon-monoxide dehydrogenase medium subunit
MKPGALSYFRPNTVQDAISMLAEGGMDAKVLAGGQSLVPMLNLRMVSAERLIDIGGIPDLAEWSADDREVRIGACVTHERIQFGEIADPSNGLMPKVASAIAYQAIRNRGTIGGSLALADPSADWPTTTAALGAIIEWEGPDGKNSCPSEEFVVAAYTTRLEMPDLLTGIRIPRLHPDATWGTYKLCRKTGEFAHAMAMVIRAPKASRAFLGATDGAPIRLAHTEEVLSALRNWQASDAAVVSQAMDADLAASGRELTDIRIWQSRTCLLRSMQMSFGIEPAKLESI